MKAPKNICTKFHKKILNGSQEIGEHKKILDALNWGKNNPKCPLPLGRVTILRKSKLLAKCHKKIFNHS